MSIQLFLTVAEAPSSAAVDPNTWTPVPGAPTTPVDVELWLSDGDDADLGILRPASVDYKHSGPRAWFAAVLVDGDGRCIVVWQRRPQLMEDGDVLTFHVGPMALPTQTKARGALSEDRTEIAGLSKLAAAAYTWELSPEEAAKYSRDPSWNRWRMFTDDELLAISAAFSMARDDVGARLRREAPTELARRESESTEGQEP